MVDSPERDAVWLKFADTTSEAAFLVGRFLIGFALTISTTVSTLWVMELAHAKTRGILVGLLMSSLPIAGGIASVIVLCTFEGTSVWAWKGAILVFHLSFLLK
jgi:MFS family permease